MTTIAASPRFPGTMPSVASRSIATDRHIATVMAGIRNSHAKPPVQKEAVMAEDIIAMV